MSAKLKEKTGDATGEPREGIEVAIGDEGELVEGHRVEDDQPAGGALFDRSQFDREDLAIAKVDGNPIDRIALSFSGTIFLDRSDPADVALYNRLVLGRDVTLMVEGRCNATGAKGATDREGELDVIVGQKGIKVGTVYVPAVEGLEEAA